MQQERRFYQRYPVNFQLQLTVNEHTYTNTALNISADGIQVQCDDECVEQFDLCPTYPPSCHITLILASNNKPLTLRCRLIVKRRLSQFCYVLGMKFIDISETDRTSIISCYR